MKIIKSLILLGLCSVQAVHGQIPLIVPDGYYFIGNTNQLSSSMYYMYDTDATRMPYGNAVDYSNPAGRNGEPAYAYASTLKLTVTELPNFTYYFSLNADSTSYTIQSCAATGHTFMDVAPYDRRLIRFSAQPQKSFCFKMKSAYTDLTWGDNEYVVGQLRNAAIADSLKKETTTTSAFSYIEEVDSARITPAFSIRPTLGRAKGVLALWPAGDEPGQVSPLLSAKLTSLVEQAETMIATTTTTQDEATDMIAQLQEATKAYQETAPDAMNPVAEGYYFVQSAFRGFEDRQSKIKVLSFEQVDGVNRLRWNTLTVNDGSLATHIVQQGDAFTLQSYDDQKVTAPDMTAEHDLRTLSFSADAQGATFGFTPDTEGMWKMACTDAPAEYLFANNCSTGTTGLYGKNTTSDIIASGDDWKFPGFCASWYLHRAYHEVKVLSSGWNSLATSFPVEVPDGVEVYTVRQDGETLYLKPYTNNVIPARTAVIIHAAKGTYDFMSTNASAPVITDNALLANCTATKVTAGTVSLVSVTNGEAGMKKSSSSSLAAGVAYLPYAEGQETFRIFQEDPDGISSLSATQQENSDAYDLSGRKLNPSTARQHKGIIISNGKKTIY